MSLRVSVVAACGIAIAFAFACSGGGGQPDGGSNDASQEAEAAAIPYPAPHMAMPKAVNSGGSVMASPKIVAISFQNDPLQSAVDAFASQLVTSPDYWKGAVSEYGVGPVTQVVYHAAETPPANLTDADVQAWITNKIQTDSTFPQPDANTIYTLFYPNGVNVTASFGVTCQQFQGYHDSYVLSSTTTGDGGVGDGGDGGEGGVTDGGGASGNVIYAIVPRCPAPPVQGVTVADQMTAEASHELVEAVTDPYPSSTTPTYISVDTDSLAWVLLAGGEIGDLCGAFPNSFYKPAGFDNLVQRVWSNASAAASHDPCEPAGTTPYFNSAPLMNDTITINVGGGPQKTKGIKVPIGQSVDVEVDLYSDAPTSGPWKVTVMDITSAFFGGKPALSFVLDKDTGQNGDKITMTVTLLRNVPGGAPFWVQSDLGGASTVWLGAVNFF